MTLVLAGYEEVIYMAADRLTTLQSASQVERFDEHENKMLIIQAFDALFILGYSGTAYVDGQPMDQWLAKIIHDLMPAPEISWGTATIFHDPRKLRSAAYISFHLKKCIESEPKITQCQLIFAGFWRKGSIDTPLLHKWSKGWKYAANSPKPFGNVPNRTAFEMIGNVPTEESIRKLIAETYLEVDVDSERVGAKRVAKFIQKCSAESAYIGDDVNVVAINPNGGNISVEFFRGIPKTNPVTFSQQPASLNTVFCPWLLFHTMTQSPTMLSTYVSIEGYPTVRFFNATEKPHDRHGRLIAIDTQVRKTWPPR
ncbi:hypothetical protein [Polymorphobacter fuscus]|uniref:Uncharacterized protein n=1 Tax=Sandarakinorhabdus fusca TaxID=1439888 RepID=A0A7C9GN69_9SPHN|nr:hypothetical protein [Polymorphobacter fuscus]KAB7648172.1 hypothetical protein F9290_00115 [Polymorphobacter fuscus]MQT15670.1 hypothetical protein [Polymorphobacter fuscus]NJC08060.1 hypothetical protein [Polymorphobacter fuscus]